MIVDQLSVYEPALPSHPWPARPPRDDFSSTTLDDEWNTIGPLGAGTWSLTERPGFLRLHDQEPLLSFSATTAFVGRRQTEWTSRSEAQLEFDPKSENEKESRLDEQRCRSSLYRCRPRSARMLLYQRGMAIPADSMLIGNLQGETGLWRVRVATEVGSRPLLLCDFRKVSPEDQAHYADWIGRYLALREQVPLNQ